MSRSVVKSPYHQIQTDICLGDPQIQTDRFPLVPLRPMTCGNIRALDFQSLIFQSHLLFRGFKLHFSEWDSSRVSLHEVVPLSTDSRLPVALLWTTSQLRQLFVVHRTVLQTDFSAAWEGSWQGLDTKNNGQGKALCSSDLMNNNSCIAPKCQLMIMLIHDRKV